jgi:nicotinamidase/pyrazinamidase
MSATQALLLVDLQNDFFPPQGALAVPHGDQIIPVVNEYIKKFQGKDLPIFASRDLHPLKTGHFKDHGGLWPSHCVQNTEGARFHPDVLLPEETVIVSKGMKPEEDAYSVFQAYGPDGKHFRSLLDTLGVKRIYIAGLATDYCVKSTVLDACTMGFQVTVLLDGIRGVDLEVNDSARALDQILRACAKTATLNTVFK